MKLCCNPLTGLTDCIGTADFSVVAVAKGGTRFFAMQGRMCDQSEEEKFLNLPQDRDLPRPIRVVLQVAIRYCPFCGTDLGSFIDLNRDAFDRFATTCRELILQ